MKLTKQWLIKHNACEEGYEWFLEQKTTDTNKLFKIALKAERYDDINWFLSRRLTEKQCRQYAIYAAKSCIKIYEKYYPNDSRPLTDTHKPPPFLSL